MDDEEFQSDSSGRNNGSKKDACQERIEFSFFEEGLSASPIVSIAQDDNCRDHEICSEHQEPDPNSTPPAYKVYRNDPRGNTWYYSYLKTGSAPTCSGFLRRRAPTLPLSDPTSIQPENGARVGFQHRLTGAYDGSRKTSRVLAYQPSCP